MFVWWSVACVVGGAFVAGVAVGALLLAWFGWEPLFRRALTIARRRPHHLLAKRCCRRDHDCEWRMLASLVQSFAARPLTPADEAALTATTHDDTRAKAMRSAPLLCDNDSSVGTVSGATRLFMVQHEVRHLMDCLSKPAHMQPLERVLERASAQDDDESDNQALATEFRSALTSLGKAPRALLQAIVVLGQSQEGTVADAAAWHRVCGDLFAPPMYLSPRSLAYFMQHRTRLHALVMRDTAAVDDDDDLHLLAHAPSLHHAASVAAPTADMDVAWLNRVWRRWWGEYASSPPVAAALLAKLNRLVQAKVATQSAIDAIELTALALGDVAPECLGVAQLPTLDPDHVCLSVAVAYAGDVHMDLGLRVTLSHLVAHETTLALRLHVHSFHGRLRVFIPSRGADPGFGYVAFESAPAFDLAVASCPPHVEALPQLSVLLSTELRDAVAQRMTLPMWLRVALPWDAEPALDSLFPQLSSSSMRGKPHAANLAAAAGGFMGEVMGGVVGGRLGGHVARGVGETVGGHLAKYATEKFGPMVKEAMQHAKEMTHHDEHTMTQHSVESLVRLAKHHGGQATTTLEARPCDPSTEAHHRTEGHELVTKARGNDGASLPPAKTPTGTTPAITPTGTTPAITISNLVSRAKATSPSSVSSTSNSPPRRDK
ncbi:Aste57867_21248 [Aphanomyces stellatus]|uniref:Aste57867_21248 protein n=1 Tax=Aphanomyces stellatus TaxID=120398 RepID=A0A485LJ49_9STRA|nr:hypothetical protein As57867_021179 [Aphanomyces stellatus]VFT97920.1 Aste57867_21248 [Aphanomyces stellatus]